MCVAMINGGGVFDKKEYKTTRENGILDEMRR